jgi:hypothetical protein
MADYSTRNIIDYAYDDDGKSFRDALYAEIHDRVANQFQIRKQDLAQSFLAPEQAFGLQPEDKRIGPMDSKDEPHDDNPGEIKKSKKQPGYGNIKKEEVESLTEGKMDRMSLTNLWHEHAKHAYIADQGWGGMHRSSDHNAATAIENHVRKHHGNKCADDMCAHSEHHIVYTVHAGPSEKPHHEQAAAKLRSKHGVKGTIYGEHEAGHRAAHPSAGTAIRT